jgi:carboxymethylenebutenolidase
MTITTKLHPDVAPFAPKEEFSRREFVASMLATGFAASVMPVSAQTITTDTKGIKVGEVKIAAPGLEMPAYFAMPDVDKASAKPLPTILVVQEIFGVHEHIRDVCRRFAKAGFLAVAPELYARQGDVSKITDMKEIMPIVAKVPDAQVMADLDATAAWAAKNGGDATKVGVTGFCWGGRITWMYAAHNKNLKAGVAWYGGLIRATTENTPRHPIDVAASLKVPVLGLYGGADTGIPNDTVEKMQGVLKAVKSSSEIILFPETPHGFYADYRPSYRKAIADDAWTKALAWFSKNGLA